MVWDGFGLFFHIFPNIPGFCWGSQALTGQVVKLQAERTKLTKDLEEERLVLGGREREQKKCKFFIFLKNFIC